MAKFKYIGPPETARFKGGSYSVGDTVDVEESRGDLFRNHQGFEELSAPKTPKQSAKKSKKPAEKPEAEKETSKE